MTDATSTRATRPDDDDGVHATDVRDAAAKHESKHTRLIHSARDGRVLSALMLPFFVARPPSGFGVIKPSAAKPALLLRTRTDRARRTDAHARSSSRAER
jgi:hypothetical protein